jgi:hypothetical protein
MGKPLGNNAPATLAEVETGPSDASRLQLLRPFYAHGGLPTSEAAIGTAKKAIFARCIVPCSGVLHDIAVANGETVNGEHNVAVFDTGQAASGKYTPLWESGKVAAAGEKGWQVVGDPGLTVFEGQQLLLAAMNTGTTHKYGTVGAAVPAGCVTLPAGYAPLSSGNLPKLNGTKTFGEAKFATITEAELTAIALPLVILGRIA